MVCRICMAPIDEVGVKYGRMCLPCFTEAVERLTRSIDSAGSLEEATRLYVEGMEALGADVEREARNAYRLLSR